MVQGMILEVLRHLKVIKLQGVECTDTDMSLRHVLMYPRNCLEKHVCVKMKRNS